MERTLQASSTAATVPRDDQPIPEHSAQVRMGRELLLATRPFASERVVATSWWLVSST